MVDERPTGGQEVVLGGLLEHELSSRLVVSADCHEKVSDVAI